MHDANTAEATLVEQLKRPLLVILTLVVLLVFADLINSYAWLWVGLFGAVGIFAHARYDSYALLIVGAFLTGSGVGILLEASFSFTGTYLTSVGAALAMVEFVAPRPSRMALWLGAAAIAMGVGLGLAEAGSRGWLALCLLAAAAGAYLASRRG